MRVFGRLQVLGLGILLLGASAAGCSSADEGTAATAEGRVGETKEALRWSHGSPAIVVDWDARLFAIDPTPAKDRMLAIMHLAMFDAVNSIYRDYEPYKYLETTPEGTSAEAAAAQAAYRVLIRRYPAAAAAIEAQRTASLATVADGQPKTDGITLGDKVANQLFDFRSTDKYSLPNPLYTPGPDPDDYKPTPPGFVNPVNQNASIWVPFAVETADQFRPGPPKAITSRQFTKDYNEVKSIGVACPDPTACARTPEQTSIAQFFIEQAHPLMFRAARGIVTREGFSLYDAARLFAYLSLAQIDAAQTVFDSKYAYNLLRPVTAIRQGETDGNPRTAGDAAWTPLLVTPPHPEYGAGHPWVSGALIVVMKAFFGEHYPLDMTSATSPYVLHIDRWKDFAESSADARVWGGIHYRTTTEISIRQGKKVGKYIVKNYLRRAEDHHHHDRGDDGDDHDGDRDCRD